MCQVWLTNDECGNPNVMLCVCVMCQCWHSMSFMGIIC